MTLANVTRSEVGAKAFCALCPNHFTHLINLLANNKCSTPVNATEIVKDPLEYLAASLSNLTQATSSSSSLFIKTSINRYVR